MTLKAIRQLTNIAWIIGGVSAATAGYSYINSKKDQVLLEYIPKPLGTISSIEDIEDYEKQRGCQFLFFTKKEKVTTNKLPDDYGSQEGFVRPAVPVATKSPATASIVRTSADAISPRSSPVVPQAKASDSLNIPRYNEWNDGGVLSARSYVSKNDKRMDEVIKKAEAMKGQCERGKIIYEEIEDTTALINPSRDSQSD
ncbi:hypothetical protein A6V39_03565 [Candidatus Mycoplasma haematobovis]|uniref:Uncharacterized protein n=1 Tax=Candidatus Mycoplasma haematobovis TaxID=432608 RepID=A0A1A9QCZ5_9MOLU|nr:hypothetical protein [Candidatus Mycoplasma haematobovis]OAL09964.1 hypothetical protein A6V39_03565 [Candidatus Mycoplasma haematobovis]